MNAAQKPALMLLEAVLALILKSTGRSNAGLAGANLVRAVGTLRVKASVLLHDGGLFPALANCFDLARQTGATFLALEATRVAILVLPTTDAAALILRSGCVGLCLAQEAILIADTDFVSRDDVDAAQATLRAAFEAAILDAANAKDNEVYRALITLQAAVVRDLVSRGRPLPRMVSYAFAQSMPALVLSNRLYGDASRYAELIAENRTVHPLFVQRAGRALSA